jgi:hypothetical protein
MAIRGTGWRRHWAPATLRLSMLAAALCAGLLTLAIAPPPARAGQWMQVSCMNPDGSPAPSEGWSGAATGPADSGGEVNAGCAPGSPLSASLSELSAAPGGAAEYLQYEPPAGSTLAGGAVDASLDSDGYGQDSSGNVNAVAYVRLYEPGLVNDTGDNFFQCVAWLAACAPGNSVDFAGQATLPADRGGDFFVEAACSSSSGGSCNENGKAGAWALAQIDWAHFLLSSDVSPQGAGFSGSALQPGVRGTGHAVFTASVAAGPGIYQVGVAIDGREVWAGTPNTNGGECVPVGTDPATGALMFDRQQPCLATEVVDAPVPTAGLSDGAHELAITVTDAAGNSSTVLDQTITTSNPEVTPIARGRAAIHAQFVISWHWTGRHTQLRTIAAHRLPRGGRLAVRCSGAGCPRLAIRSEPARLATRLLRGLQGRMLTAGDQLRITVSAPRRRTERVELRIRADQVPLARLVK